MASGNPFLKNGVKVGWSDFSEFSVAAGLPSGITEFGIHGDSPSAVAIVNDPSEGNYFKMTGQDQLAGWAFGLDSFDGQIGFGEILARVYFSVHRNNRRSIGPVFSLSGLVGPPSSDLTYTGGSLYQNLSDDLLSHGVIVVNGSGGVPASGIIQEAVQNPGWMWFRVRRTQGVGDPAKDDWQLTSWYGDLEDEPATPDEVVTDANVGPRGVLAMGWAETAFGTSDEQRIAFLSFTADPLLAAPPEAGESADRWFPSNVPGATTWVPS